LILWIAGDAISIFLFAYEKTLFQQLPVPGLTIIAVLGYMEWNGKLKRVKSEGEE